MLIVWIKQLLEKACGGSSTPSRIASTNPAGAANVIMPEKAGGAQMATLVIQPDAAELLSYMGTRNNEQFRVTELAVTKAVNLGQLDLWNKTGCTLLGIKNTDGSYTLNPTPADLLQPGESIIVMGGDAQLTRATALL